MSTDSTPLYQRILLKLSGEALQGEQPSGLSSVALDRIVDEVTALTTVGVQIAIVVGAGNFCRGRTMVNQGFDAITCDQIGMLATVMNGLVLRDAFLQRGLGATVMSAFAVAGMTESFSRMKAIDLLEQGQVVIFTGGTGNPLVTTDSAASLRSIEINADVLLKATNVDGVYSADPKQDANAKRYSRLNYDEVVAKQLAVMDLNAFYQCRTYGMPIRVFNINEPGVLIKVLYDEQQGTLIEGD